jgi:hypothetical protein
MHFPFFHLRYAINLVHFSTVESLDSVLQIIFASKRKRNYAVGTDCNNAVFPEIQMGAVPSVLFVFLNLS